MFFYAFIGEEEYQQHFQEMIETFSEGLNLKGELKHNDSFSDGTPFSLIWRYHSNTHQYPYLNVAENHLDAITGYYIDDLQDVSSGPMSMLDPGNPTRFRIDKERWSFVLDAPLMSIEQIYYYADGRGVLISSDLRPFLRWTNQDLEPLSVYSLLQYGNVPPPSTLIKNVHRVPYGHQLRVVQGEGFPKVVNQLPPILEWPRFPGSETPQKTTTKLLDDRLGALPENIGIFFSGGVDSGLLAARLAEIGRKDVLLVNCEFGENDPESQLAEDMAKVLNLPFKRVSFTNDIMIKTLDNIGHNYSYPFGDEASIGVNMMLQGCSELCNSSVVLDGAGADNAFGIGYKSQWWSKGIQSLPTSLLRMIDSLYTPIRPWWSRNFKIEKPWRIAHQALTMDPLTLGSIAQHAMDKLAFDIPDSIHEAIRTVSIDSIERLISNLDDDSKHSIFGLLHESIDAFANKSYDLMKHQGIETVCPFLEGPMLRFGTSLTSGQKSPDGEDKALLKRPLAELVPKEMVYRKKSGFIPPVHLTLKDSDVQDRLRYALLENNTPLANYINQEFFTDLLDRGYTGKSISHGAMKSMWAAAFTSLWYLEAINSIFD